MALLTSGPFMVVAGIATGLALLFRGELAESFHSFCETATTTFRVGSYALAAGRIEVGLEAAAAGLKATWAEAMLFLPVRRAQCHDPVVLGWHKLPTALGTDGV